MAFDNDRALQIIMPAARAAVARRLRMEHGMRQQDIARLLGISQALVNKYLNGRCSEKVLALERYVSVTGLDREAAALVLADRDNGRKRAEALFLSRRVFARAAAILGATDTIP